MLSYILILLIILVAYLAYTFYVRPVRLKAHYSKVLKEKGYKVFEHPYQMLKAPFYDQWLTDQKDHGDFNYTAKNVYSQDYDIILFNVLSEIAVMVLKPDLIKQIFHKDMIDKLIKKNTAFEIFKYIVQRGLVFIEKDVWRHRRKLISKVFNFQFITSQIPTMAKTATQLFQRLQEEYWKKNPQKRQKKQIEIEVYNSMAKYTSSIVMSSFLGLGSMKQELKGKTIQEEIIRLHQMSILLSRDPLVMVFGEKILKLGAKKSFRELLQLNKEIDQILLSYIKRHRQNQKSNLKKAENQPKSIVELILEQIRNGQKEGQNITITDQDLVDQIKTFVIAGTDTTSNYTTMALFLIYQHKHVLDRLRSQIQAVIKDDSGITLQNIKKIKYFEPVLTQVSRVFPTAQNIFNRTLGEDTVLDGITYEKGMCMSYYLRPMVSNPNIFPQPFEFKPERWFKQSEENKQLTQFVSFQFSGGPRGCIGKHLALTEAKVMIIKFLKRYQTLIEPGINNRRYSIQLTSHLDNDKAILTKKNV